MTGRKFLLAWCAVLGLAACQDVGSDSEHCLGDKCDDLGQSGFGKVMPRAPSTPGTIAITRNDESFLFEVIGRKGEIVLLSQDYAERASAVNGILSVEENGVLEDRYSVVEISGGWAFTLRAGNNEVLAQSQVYASLTEAEEAARGARDLIAGIVQYKAALTRGAQFGLSRDDDSWTFELRSEDGQPLLASQSYSRRRDAITGIESVRQNGKDAARYTIVDSPPRFVLKAANGQEIAESSTTFESEGAAEAAIASTQAMLVSERVANPW